MPLVIVLQPRFSGDASHQAARREVGTRLAIVAGFGLAALGFGALAFVESSWTYAAFVLPLIVLSAGLGLSNGPASSASTSSVPADQVGQASGISNMARYIGAALFVAFTATIYNSVQIDQEKSGASASDALAAALSRVSLVLAICSAAGIALALLMARHHQRKAKAVDLAAAAARARTLFRPGPSRRALSARAPARSARRRTSNQLGCGTILM